MNFIKNIKSTNKPLCENFKEDGIINFYSISDNINDFEGIFSFVLYFHKSYNDFISSKYYTGLLIYAKIINQNQFFRNYGMIIYTDIKTYEILKLIFLDYLKVIIAVVKWNKFSIDNTIEGTILRCLRFQALEAFPNSDVLIRDADTIFPSEIFTTKKLFLNGFTGKDINGDIIENYIDFFIDKIGEWEKIFINEWEKNKSCIIVGVSLNYFANWHKEIPFNFNKNNKYYLSSKLYFNSPAGVFAGFINFLKTRNNNLWLDSYNYINSHYYLKKYENYENYKNTKFNPSISNSSKNMIHVGKDERIIIFAILLRNWRESFFFPIEYYDSMKYYKTINNFNKNHYSNNNIIQNYTKVINTKKLILIIYNKNNNSKTLFDLTKIKNPIIFTKILDPEYIINAFNLKISENMINKIEKNPSIKKIIRLPIITKELSIVNKDKELNIIYKKYFEKFQKEYLEWIKKIKNTPIEDILFKLKEQYNKDINSFGENLRLEIGDIKFIYNSSINLINSNK